jgi:hypothetical protein
MMTPPIILLAPLNGRATANNPCVSLPSQDAPLFPGVNTMSLASPSPIKKKSRQLQCRSGRRGMMVPEGVIDEEEEEDDEGGRIIIIIIIIIIIMPLGATGHDGTRRSH